VESQKWILNQKQDRLNKKKFNCPIESTLANLIWMLIGKFESLGFLIKALFETRSEKRRKKSKFFNKVSGCESVNQKEKN